MKFFRYILSFWVFGGSCLPGYGQLREQVRFKDPVFKEVIVEKDLWYGSPSSEGKTSSYGFDLYQPEADSMSRRPLVIWIHGGGFKFGSKKAKGVRLWSTSFAKKGYVCAAINYRLSKKNPLFHFAELVRSCDDAVQDARQAIVYFKENYALFRIDTNRIILAGNSAGGMIALQAAYRCDTSSTVPKHGSRSDSVGTPYSTAKIAAVINFWGAIFDINWLKNSKIPIVSVHGTRDKIVPFDHKGSGFFGSFAIHTKADSLKIPNSLKTYDGYSHELQKHFNPFFNGKGTKKRWLEAGQFAADFLYDQLFQKVGAMGKSRLADRNE